MKGTLLASILAAAGASLCCTGPLLLLLFGSTTVGMFSFLEPIRPYASVLALGILGWAYVRTFRPQPEKDCCDINQEATMKKQKLQKRTLIGITPLVLALVFFPYYGGFLYGGDTPKGEQQAGVVTEWTIEGMTCEMCAKGLQGGMSAVKGVSNCTVDFGTKTMVCTVDQNQVKVEDVPALVEKIGYKAVPKKVPSAEESKTSPKS
jgi:copper chaperone CopZ